MVEGSDKEGGRRVKDNIGPAVLAQIDRVLVGGVKVCI
jgi:hypothetical protein